MRLSTLYRFKVPRPLCYGQAGVASSFGNAQDTSALDRIACDAWRALIEQRVGDILRDI